MADSPPAKRRFAPAQAADVDKAAVSSVPTNTKAATHFWVRVFQSFCEENGETVDLSTCSPKDLNALLSRFYVGLRTQKGEYYKKSSYMAARAALSRYLVTVLNREECNLYRCAAFKQSNVVLDGVLKMKKADGHEPSAEHKTAICDEDLAKLHSYFEDVLDVPDPVKLTYFCWYHLTLHFALRGSEIQTQLKKQDIVIEIDPNGKEYVTLKRDFMSKNCAGGLDGREFVSCGRVQDHVQVAAIKKNS